MVAMDAVVLTHVAEMNKGLLRMGGHRPKSDGGLLAFVELDIRASRQNRPSHRALSVVPRVSRAFFVLEAHHDMSSKAVMTRATASF